MYCKRCMYDLAGLEEHRCPECGRRFEPTKRRSYSKAPHRRINPIGWLTIATSVLPWLIYATLILMWVCGRVAIGHWPVKWRDDPWYIDHAGVQLFGRCAYVLMVLTPFALCAALVGLLAYLGCAIVGTHRWRALLRTAIATLLLWGSGIAVILFEPFELLAWFFD